MIDDETFRDWMSKIMVRLERCEHLILLKANNTDEQPLRNRKPALWEGEYLLDNQDLCMLLQVSKRSLQRYRSLKILPYLMLRQKTYYKESDVITFLTEHIKELKKDDAEFYKARIHQFLNK